MKNASLFLFAVVFASTVHAVNITWATDNEEAESISLVYMAEGDFGVANFNEDGTLNASTVTQVFSADEFEKGYGGGGEYEAATIPAGSYTMLLLKSSEDGPVATWETLSNTDFAAHGTSGGMDDFNVEPWVFSGAEWTAVPEPTAVALFLLGLGGVALRRKGGVA